MAVRLVFELEVVTIERCVLPGVVRILFQAVVGLSIVIFCETEVFDGELRVHLINNYR